MMDKLKPCPFCGRTPRISMCNQGTNISCEHCRIQIRFIGEEWRYNMGRGCTAEENESACTEIWNRRTS